jgi:hypothetical protein
LPGFQEGRLEQVSQGCQQRSGSNSEDLKACKAQQHMFPEELMEGLVVDLNISLPETERGQGIMLHANLNCRPSKNDACNPGSDDCE